MQVGCAEKRNKSQMGGRSKGQAVLLSEEWYKAGLGGCECTNKE